MSTTAARQKRPGRRATDLSAALLIEAGAVLASSLDPAVTMGQVARLTVRELADLCVIDLCDDDGSIRGVAVAATDDGLARALEQLRARSPLDPAGEHPAARVIRSGEPLLFTEVSEGLLTTMAAGSEHARFMIDNDYRSIITAPLRARDRTLGSLSVLRLGDSIAFSEDDLELVCELARRAALAIDNANLHSQLLRAERRLDAVLAGLAEAVTVVNADGRTVFANRAAADLLGVANVDELLHAPPGAIWSRYGVFDEHGAALDLDRMPARRLLRGEEPGALLVRNVVRATGEERWLIVRASALADPDSGEITHAVNVFENVTEIKRAQLAESFMSDASQVLASSLDYAETLTQVARLAVPQLADWCAVDVLNARGEIERVAVHHSDPDKIALAERLDRDYRPSPDDDAGVAAVIRTGEPLLAREIPADSLAAVARDPEHLALLQSVGATSVIIVPLAGPTRTLGTITLVGAESGRRLTQADVGVAVRLGRRAGTAVEQARIYTERSNIAQTLQRALLPDALPEIPGIELSAQYTAAGELNEVGGDFYDVFAQDDDRWVLVIGDVCGKGPRAAGATALARHTLRAAATNGQSPSAMLATLHAALTRQSDDDMCTVCLVTLGPAGEDRELTVTLAGHPPPLLVDRDGVATAVGRPGTLLGALDALSHTEVTATLRPGETLLLYTDGVTEAGRSHGELGQAGLAELCRDAPGISPATLLRRIEHAAAARGGGLLRDDIAMLAVRAHDHSTD